MNSKCSCGGTYVQVEGLEGYYCDCCGGYKEIIESHDFAESNFKPDYSEEKLKSIRGIPVNRIIIGSESKGRVEISIPIFVSYDEQKKIIEQQLSLLEYTKAQILEKNLDIMPKR
jgi:hypothetical protein